MSQRMRRSRLLAVTHEYSRSGAPIALLNLLPGLASRFDILVASPIDGPLRDQFLDKNVQAIVVPNLDKDADMSVGLLLSFDALLASTLLSFVSIYAAHQMQKPSLWYIQEGQIAKQFFEVLGPGLSAAFSMATRLVVPCHFYQRFYSTQRTGIEVVPYGVEHRELAPQLPPSGPMRILQLGTIEHRKGQDITCAAVRLLKDQPIQVDIVGRIGETDYHRKLLSHCADLPQVRFVPQVDPSQTEALMAGCDVLVVPSRDEVTGLVILEAMAAGKPVIAAAVGGIPEIIVDGQTGFLFKSQDSRQLAGIVARLINDEPTRRAVGTAGRNFVRASRTLEQYHEQFENILLELPGFVQGG